MTGRTIADSVDDYINGFAGELQERLLAIRATIRAAAPAAAEGIAYAIPAYKLNGPLIYFAAHARHIGLYPVIGACREAFAAELAGYGGGKGTVQFPHDAPLPHDLIARIVMFRADEQLAKRKAKASRPKT